MTCSKRVFVGVGSSHGDDQIGWLLADYLQSLNLSDVVIRKASSPLEILDWLDGVEWLGIGDACQGVGPPGSWHRWTWPDEEIRHHRFTGTHDMGLAAVLELASRLKRLPLKVVVWGIEISQCAPGEEMTREAIRGLPELAVEIETELRPWANDD